jgi:hypothetical protein
MGPPYNYEDVGTLKIETVRSDGGSNISPRGMQQCRGGRQRKEMYGS